MSAGGITEADYIFFTMGDFFEAEGYKDGKTEKDLKAFWKDHREAILDRYFEESRLKGPGWYGCRPWSYWKWDVTKPRLPVDMSSWPENKLYDPRIIGSNGLEADHAFLKRLGLLEGWELEI